MNDQISDELDGSFADLIFILRSIAKDDDKDWLLDDEGNKVSL
jgi:hypothetical protein